MKQILLVFLCLLLSISIHAQEVRFSPEKPIPGSTIEIIYNPTDGPFSGKQAFDAAIYVAADEWEAQNLALKLDGEVYKASFKTPENTKAIFLSFFNEEKELVENNGGVGYSLVMYQGDQAVEGAYAAKAIAVGGFSRLLKVDLDFTQSITYLQKEFELYPQSKEANLDNYAFAGKSTENTEILEEVETIISQIRGDQNASEERLGFALKAASALGNEEMITELENEVRAKYPEGQRAAALFAETFYSTRNIDEREAILQEYLEKFSEAEKTIQYAQNMIARIAMAYSQAGEWGTFEAKAALLENIDAKANILNEAAWGMSGEALDSEATELARALSYSKKSLELIEESKKTLANKPPLYTPKQWQRIKDGNYALYADTYALLLYKEGDHAQAYKYQKICCEAYKYSDTDMNHRLSVYLEKSKGKDEALTFLEEMMAEGKVNAAMKENYQSLFFANGGTKEAYKNKINAFQSEALKNLKEEVSQKMISEKAADFTLVNTKGEEVSLANLKGKVIVLDFWATWCGPCIASFPGMKKAADKYKDNEDVVFLFANTWENGDNKTAKAAKFMEKKGYDFNILMDEEDKVVSDYGVEGIPTKFVIDKTGRVRFKSVGFQQNEDMLINELSMMIELAAEKSGVGLE